MNIGERGVKRSKTLIMDRRRASLLIFIMVVITLGIAGMTVSVLCKAAFDQECERLVETAQSRTRLVEAVTQFNAHYPVEANPE